MKKEKTGKKRHFYKNIWFWTTVVFAVIAMITLAAAGSFLEESEGYQQKYEAVKKKNKKLNATNKAMDSLLGTSFDDESDSDDDTGGTESDTYTGNFGDPAEFESGEIITVSKAVDSPNTLLSDMGGEKPVAVSVTVENTNSSPLDFNAQEFDLYDGKDEVAQFSSESYDKDIPDYIAAGKKATMTLYFGATNSGPYSVTFGDFTWEQKE